MRLNLKPPSPRITDTSIRSTKVPTAYFGEDHDFGTLCDGFATYLKTANSFCLSHKVNGDLIPDHKANKRHRQEAVNYLTGLASSLRGVEFKLDSKGLAVMLVKGKLYSPNGSANKNSL